MKLIPFETLIMICVFSIAALALMMRRRRRRELSTAEKISQLRNLTEVDGLTEADRAEREEIRMKVIQLVRMMLNHRRVLEIAEDLVADHRFVTAPEDVAAVRRVRADYRKSLDFAKGALFECCCPFTHGRLHVYTRHCALVYMEAVDTVANLLEFRFPELVPQLEAHL